MAGSSPDATNPWIGRTVSGVRIERLLGRGGMAEVFLGHHLRLGRPVAIKILHARVREDPNLLKMLESEAAALTSMQHPNIVRCIDCNVVDGRPYIVMELLDGITLHDRLENLSRDGLLPPLHVVERLIRSTADALDHAHARGVVHRDLKPANIMLLSMAGPIDRALPLPADVQAMITDFGLARLTDAAHSTSGALVGTPAYMSPEQASDRPVDARSDIYALGVILYQLLAGRVPFGQQGGSMASVLYQHAFQPPPRVANLRYPPAGDLGAELDRAVSVHGFSRSPDAPIGAPA